MCNRSTRERRPDSEPNKSNALAETICLGCCAQCIDQRVAEDGEARRSVDRFTRHSCNTTVSSPESCCTASATADGPHHVGSAGDEAFGELRQLEQ